MSASFGWKRSGTLFSSSSSSSRDLYLEIENNDQFRVLLLTWPWHFLRCFRRKIVATTIMQFWINKGKEGEKTLLFLTKKSKVFQWFQTVYINEKRNTNCRVMYTLSTRCFWATDANRKAVFLFNLSSHFHIYIVKYLFLIGKFGDTTVLACEMFTSGIPSVAQKPILLKLSLKVMLLLVLR